MFKGWCDSRCWGSANGANMHNPPSQVKRQRLATYFDQVFSRPVLQGSPPSPQQVQQTSPQQFFQHAIPSQYYPQQSYNPFVSAGGAIRASY
eukprot:9760812-Ditylum_brightwellii.AAC.1